jgi:hypothetical protein
MAEISTQDEIALNNFMERRRALIMRLQEAKGLKASGLSAKLLYVKSNKNVFDLVDSAGYFEFQEFGRADGGQPPFKKIYEWLEYKKYGLKYDNDEERVSLAWAIAKKIKKKGTHTYMKGRDTGVISEAINKEATAELIKEIAKNRKTEILTDIKRILVKEIK